MLIQDIKNIKSNKSDLRKFGISVGIVLGLLGGLLLWKQKDSYIYFLTISFILICFGIIFPQILKPLQKAWMTFAVIIGWFMTRVLLSILFYFGMTTIRIIASIFGEKFLDIKHSKPDKNSSYWIPREKVKLDKKSYEKQF